MKACFKKEKRYLACPQCKFLMEGAKKLDKEQIVSMPESANHALADRTLTNLD